MNKFTLGIRWVYGLFFLIFGLNGFFNFMPSPPPMPDAAMSFLGALGGSGYMFPLIKITEISAGALLLAGLTPIALILLSPIVVNIVLFHLLLAPGGYPLLAFMLFAQIYLAYTHFDHFKPLFQRKSL